jgi:hypothetical protein
VGTAAPLGVDAIDLFIACPLVRCVIVTIASIQTLRRVYVIEPDIDAALEKHAADQREHRQPRVHEQRDLHHQRQRAAERRFEHEAREQPDQRDEAENHQIVAAQPHDETEHAPRIERLHDGVGRAPRQRQRAELRPQRVAAERATIADPVARPVGGIEQADHHQQQDQRARSLSRLTISIDSTGGSAAPSAA